uniref:Uncharacterized protein n=1 Tax=Nelumbo nucifera TaxID=4432 RepID=A0A822ZL41_NELNU|nr:TPA_asm: hypothetical protein HUJ06_003847 [Nelumbo nucifera]
MTVHIKPKRQKKPRYQSSPMPKNYLNKTSDPRIPIQASISVNTVQESLPSKVGPILQAKVLESLSFSADLEDVVANCGKEKKSGNHYSIRRGEARAHLVCLLWRGRVCSSLIYD